MDAGFAQSGMLWFAALSVFAAAAVAMFVALQVWISNPERRAYNEAWFREFEERQQQRYRSDPELRWRMRVMAELFGSQRL